MKGEVVDLAGRPVTGVLAFALHPRTKVVIETASTDAQGHFQMQLGHRKHLFGVLSAAWQVVSADPVGSDSVKVRVASVPLGPEPDFVRPESSVAVDVPASMPGLPRDSASPPVGLGEVHGKIVDEAGVPIPGVRVIAFDPRLRRPLAVAWSGRDGRFVLTTRSGLCQLRFFAPGLKLAKVDEKARGGHADASIVMAIDAVAQEVIVSPNKILRFKMSDSIHPEVIPPPVVANYIRFAYGIDYEALVERSLTFQDDPFRGLAPGARGAHPFGWNVSESNPYRAPMPSSVVERRKALPKYWWLILLQAPPNPARTAHW